MTTETETETGYQVTFIGDYFTLSTAIYAKPDEDEDEIEQIAKKHLEHQTGFRLDYKDAYGGLRSLYGQVEIEVLD